jgi:pimeloyl-ACP methyl ester carboxylesterase
VVLGIALVTAFLTGSPSSAQTAHDEVGARMPGVIGLTKGGDWSVPSRRAPAAASTTGGAALVRSAAASLTPCEEDATFLCATVPVPLDRRRPDGRTVGIHVEVLPHTGATAAAESAVLVTCGGPGCSITSGPKYGFSFFLLPEIAETHDLVFVDQRGVGLSDVIDCPALQAGEFPHLYRDARACHEQLGDTADLYSTTDVADDLEDVRVALGYDDVDLFGGSYAGDDMLVHAIRHPDHVRSMVLSSPALWVDVDPFYAYAPKSMPRIVSTICRRSPACAAAHPHPARDFAELALELRRRPVAGTGVDSTGQTHRMEVTETILSNFITYLDGGAQAGPAELTAAAAALRRGDSVPLLRLAADVDPANGFGDDPRVFSNGHNLARNCVDGEFAFDQEAPAPVRDRQYANAYAAEPDFYGPISKKAWAAPGWLGWQPPPCIVSRWEHRPQYRSGTTVTGIPTLVLGGEYDLPVPEAVTRKALEVVPGATYVSMTGAGHDSQFWSDCGPELVQRFYRDLDVGDTSCAGRPAAGAWSPGNFVTKVGQAPPATQAGGPRATSDQRRLVTVAAWTVIDSLRHNFLSPDDSVGLRGGVVDWEVVDDVNEWSLEKVRFSPDVRVDGLIQDLQSDGVFTSEIDVRGPGTRVAASLDGAFLTYGEDATLTVDFGKGAATFTIPAY